MKSLPMEEFFRVYEKDKSNLWRNKGDGLLYEVEFDFGKALILGVKE